MPNHQVKSIETLFLGIFKGTVLLVMGAALLAVVALVGGAAYQYSQSPREPAPAQKAPVREIQVDDLRKLLIEREQKAHSRVEDGKQQLGATPTSLRFQEEATSLFRCSGEFAQKVGAEIQRTDDAANAQQLQALRVYIERLADGSRFRGENWVKVVVGFGCKAMANDAIIDLKKERKIGSVFFPLIEFHAQAWDSIQSAKQKFDHDEVNRVSSERNAEALRVAIARGRAISYLIGAGGAFGLFMLLALYLLAAKIENNLRDINESVRNVGSRRAD